METGTIRQILLITDGCSNEGEDPTVMAALAREHGITVNVIGVIENDVIHDQGVREINAIAAAGGGVSQIVMTKQLSQTVQMVTRQAMAQTIQGLVNQEIQQILGGMQTIEDLPPDKRGEIIEVVDDLGEKSQLDVLVLVDMSASMEDKLPAVKNSLEELSLSMDARLGNNRFAIFVFPGKRKNVSKLLDWTANLEDMASIFAKLTVGGTTPTGPALKEAIQYFLNRRLTKGYSSYDDESYYEGSL